MTISSPSVIESLHPLPNILHSTPDFPEILEALNQGKAATIDGAWGSSAALATAALGREASTTILVVLAHPSDIDDWQSDLTTFDGDRPEVFPAWENLPSDLAEVDATAGERLRLLKQLDDDATPSIVITTIQALLQPVPDREQLQANRHSLLVGEDVDMEDLTTWLVEHGFRSVDAVELPGEFSRRGGILDVFSPDVSNPWRVEFFGDEIDSIREFDAGTQRSLEQLSRVEITGTQVQYGEDDLPATLKMTGHLCDHLPDGAWTVLVDLNELQEQAKLYLERVSDHRGLFSLEATFKKLTAIPSVRVSAFPTPSNEVSCHLQVESVERFSGNVSTVRDELDGIALTDDHVLIACHNEAEVHRLTEVLSAGQLAQSDRLQLVLGRVSAGFRLVDANLVVLGGQELFHREGTREVLPRRQIESRAIDSFLDLKAGDLVVHISHGIARYRGMQVVEKQGREEEHLLLEFRDGLLVYVPTSKIDLVQKYVGGSKVEPELSKVGGTGWLNKKKKVQEAVEDLAAEMLELQAERAAQPGIACEPDSEWQTDFEAAFPYQETPDQLTSMAEIKKDLQRNQPMDRLICGDVGYGKTELAIRAAFKVVDNGRQVAVLVPTTVLAEQHYRTFSQRLAEYPFTVESLSRFRSKSEQRAVVERLAQGGVDIVIGTHRLVSADVKFKDLGLVIIDEEQRFGVQHKERLKQLRRKVDVLTLTATPIPRTLHFSLLGLRDISNLETPPADRKSIETRIVRFDDNLVKNAINRELNREGQIYFVHNRVHNIEQIAGRLQKIMPSAKIAIVHGQMPSEEMEQAMLQFVKREADILVATTIIESGLDIPNANTMFINQADIYGLADLHQLRGRVGRYKNRAYAYLLLDPDRSLTPTAARRLKAIEEFTDLGAGFRIALRDLEIRGAGNILGTQQSGHIASVGYELYCQLLENAVRRLRHQPVKEPLEINLDLPWTAYLPREYVESQRLRIEVYRRLSRIRSVRRLDEFRQELIDRFGSLPDVAEWLVRQAEIRILATRWQIVSVRLEQLSEGGGPTDLVLGYRSPKRIQRLADRSDGRLRVVDGSSAYFRLRKTELKELKLYETIRDLFDR